jgi:hypothetical protein
MAHILSEPEKHVGKGYLNSKNHAECVEFIQQTLKAPTTALWREGTKVTKGDTSIARGTAIATFVDGKYPQVGSTGKHAAIYLTQNGNGLVVLDQFRKQGMVKERTIKFKPTMPGLSNDGNAFSVIEWP